MNRDTKTVILSPLDRGMRMSATESEVSGYE